MIWQMEEGGSKAPFSKRNGLKVKSPYYLLSGCALFPGSTSGTIVLPVSINWKALSVGAHDTLSA